MSTTGEPDDLVSLPRYPADDDTPVLPDTPVLGDEPVLAHEPVPDDPSSAVASEDATSEFEATGSDPELAALVQGDMPPANDGDPELAALVQGDPTVDDGDPSPTALVDVVEPSAPPRRRRSFAFRFGAAFILGVLLAFGVGVGVLYALGEQYDGRVLPGVRVGSTELGGLTREQAEAKLASAYGSLGTGQVTLTSPDGQTTTMRYADLGRGPDTSALLDAALAAGRPGQLLGNLIDAPRAVIHGVTLDPAVAYDHAKLAAAIDTLARTIDQAPTNASVSADKVGTFTVSPSKEGRGVDKTALLTALDQQLAAVDAPASISMAVPVVPVAPAVDTASAEAAKASADRMAADVVIAHGKDSWTIAGTSLAPLISFTTAADGSDVPVLDQAGLDPIVKTLAAKVNQPAKDAGLKLVNGRVIATGASREGRTLDTAGMKA